MVRFLLRCCSVLSAGLITACAVAPGLRAAPQVRAVSLAAGLNHPWGLAFLPDGTLLVTERPGRLRRITAQGLDPQPISGIPPVVAQGQGGLLDVAVHPQFAQNQWIYLALAAGQPGAAGTRVVRGRLQNNQLTEVTTIVDMTRKTGAGQHFGARLTFDPDGFLYVATGDRGERDRSQDLGDHAGKVLRLHDDGRIPSDNPFIQQPGALPEVYSYGHRNIQGMTTHPQTGAIWSHEHGPRGGDEINIVQAGGNYGWPLVTFGVEYSGQPVGQGATSLPGLIPPIWHWTPSIAPSGMAFYQGDVFPEWQGDLFVGALAGQHLARLQVEGESVRQEEQLLSGDVGRIRDVRVGPDGFLYLVTDAANGQVLRLEREPV
ncbi:MAG: PQQ-dependent sugar dehydrogenase [Synechococcales cyanobacterium]